MFKLGFAGVVIRFYMMMAVVLIAGFSGQWWLALLALPIFLSAILAFRPNAKNIVQKADAKLMQMGQVEKRQAI